MTKEEAIRIYVKNIIKGPHAVLWQNIIVDLEFMIKLHQAARRKWGEDDYLEELAKIDTNETVSWEVKGCCINCEINIRNTFNIETAWKMKSERGWPLLYVMIDLHGTLIKPYHNKIEFYPYAIEVMKWFYNRNDFKTILWTSSFQEEIDKFRAVCRSHGMDVDFVNENPAEKSTDKVCMDKKFYFNILLDDRAGFDGRTDWKRIKDALIDIGEW